MALQNDPVPCRGFAGLPEAPFYLFPESFSLKWYQSETWHLIQEQRTAVFGHVTSTPPSAPLAVLSLQSSEWH